MDEAVPLFVSRALTDARGEALWPNMRWVKVKNEEKRSCLKVNQSAGNTRLMSTRLRYSPAMGSFLHRVLFLFLSLSSASKVYGKTRKFILLGYF